MDMQAEDDRPLTHDIHIDPRHDDTDLILARAATTICFPNEFRTMTDDGVMTSLPKVSRPTLRLANTCQRPRCPWNQSRNMRWALPALKDDTVGIPAKPLF